MLQLYFLLNQQLKPRGLRPENNSWSFDYKSVINIVCHKVLPDELLCFSLLLFVSQHLSSAQNKVALFSDSDTKPFILEASTNAHETVDHKPINTFSADLLY